MLKEIIKKRKQYKQELKQKPNPFKKSRSDAFKLLANASYGYQGFFGARYYQEEAAAATAAFARKSIKEAIEKINKENYKVIYSDSVDGKTKIIVKKDREIYEEEIQNLFKKTDKKTNSGKEYNFKKDIEVLTLDEGGNSIFKPARYIMRHKCNKKMYRVNFTNHWYIDVTEDHSLMGYQSHHFNQTNECKGDSLKRIIEIKPNELKKKANSIVTLKKIPNNEENSKDYPKKIYEFMGYFIGDGSFMRNKLGKDYYLRISTGSDLKEILNKLIEPLTKLGYVKNYWESKSRKGDLTLNGLKLIKIIIENCREKNNKIIPKWLFYEKEENIASFLRGLFSADGSVMIRNNSPIIKYTSINEDYIKEVRKLLYLVGISHSVFKENTKNKYKTKTKIYSTESYSKNIIIKNKEDFAKRVGFIIERKNKRAKIKTKEGRKKLIRSFEFDLQNIKLVEKIEKPKYVYDIEVEENHKFFANYILAHNTDSIAFLQNKKTKLQTRKFLDKLNSQLPGIMELELEGFFKRGLWVTKRTGVLGAEICFN